MTHVDLLSWKTLKLMTCVIFFNHLWDLCLFTLLEDPESWCWYVIDLKLNKNAIHETCIDSLPWKRWSQGWPSSLTGRWSNPQKWLVSWMIWSVEELETDRQSNPHKWLMSWMIWSVEELETDRQSNPHKWLMSWMIWSVEELETDRQSNPHKWLMSWMIWSVEELKTLHVGTEQKKPHTFHHLEERGIGRGSAQQSS